MTPNRTGFLATIDGPSGVGKSTTIRTLRPLLAELDIPAQWTEEPPRGDFLGDFTRTHGGQLHGVSLACLVAANRYRHITTTIDPALNSGELLISDRYLASTYVLQQLDGVPADFLLRLNECAPLPDLAVILTAQPDKIADRIRAASVTHRFRADPTGPGREVELYKQAVTILEDLGVKVLQIDTSEIPPSEVARRIAAALPSQPLPSEASTTQPLQES